MTVTINVAKPEPSHDRQDFARIFSFETVASYNWLDEPSPTILVPGVPPIWDPPQTDPVLRPDTGGRYVDQNADRTPGSHLQALVHAVQTCQPGFDFTNISIVTDRKPVRNLLGFVLAECFVFKFGITIIGNTALFTRMEKRTREPPPSNLIKYRDAFENGYTRISTSAARSTSHYRVVRYEFADQTILLRYAVDAYRGAFAEVLMRADGIEDSDSGTLVRRHRNMIKGNPPSKTLPTSTPITVIEDGRCIPHAAILELTTRGEHYSVPKSIERKMPDAWISQTLNYHLCFHRETRARSSRSTVFDHVIHVPIGELLIDWEKNNAEKLHALAHVLGEIIEAAREIGSSCIVSCNGKKGAPLIVSRARGKEVPALPEDMQCLFVPGQKEKWDPPFKQEEVTKIGTTAGRDGINSSKYSTGDTPKPTDSPYARRARRSVFCTPGQAVAPIEEEELNMNMRNGPVESELAA